MTLIEEHPATHSEQARRNMIDSQLRTSGVNEPRILAAMMAVSRETFVPDSYRESAYIDRAVPLGGGRYLAAPLVHARMLAEASPDASDKVLLVGDAKGYLAALLGKLAGPLDVIAPSEAAKKRRKGGYSLVVVDGAAEELPATLSAQLAEGGRMVTGLVENSVTRLASGGKSGGAISLVPLSEMGIPVLADLAAPRGWSF